MYDKLNSTPGVENLFPKFIGTVDGKRVVVANVVDGTVYLTPEGKRLLEDAPVSQDKPKAPRAKKASVETPKAVESANTLATDTADDLDLDE